MKKRFVLLILPVILALVFPGSAVAAEDPSDYADEPVLLDSFVLTPTDDGSGYLLEQQCEDVAYKRYELLDSCSKECNECVLDDENCWTCKSVPMGEQEMTIGFWDKMKLGFHLILFPKKPLPPIQMKPKQPGILERIGEAIGRLFGKGSTQQVTEAPAESISEGKQKKNTVGLSVLAYHHGETKGEESRIDAEMEDALLHADNLADLLKLRSMFMLYCYDKCHPDYDAEDACRETFMKAFRKRADELKEKLFAEIDESDGSFETYKKIIQLRSILMAGTKAGGEGEWFSTDNIKKVQAGLKKKMQAWFPNGLRKAKLEDLRIWHSLGLVYTYMGQGSGLMEGTVPLAQVQYRARRLALLQMIEIDICNPDPEKLKTFQDLLSDPGCEKLLGDAKACEYINSGNLESAYAALYEKDKDDEANNLPENQAPEPLDCSKQTTNMGENGTDATVKTMDAASAANAPISETETDYTNSANNSSEEEATNPSQTGAESYQNETSGIGNTDQTAAKNDSENSGDVGSTSETAEDQDASEDAGSESDMGTIDDTEPETPIDEDPFLPEEDAFPPGEEPPLQEDDAIHVEPVYPIPLPEGGLLPDPEPEQEHPSDTVTVVPAQ